VVARHLVDARAPRCATASSTRFSGERPIREAAPYAGVLVALVVGDQRAIAQSDWTVSPHGIGHLSRSPGCSQHARGARRVARVSTSEAPAASPSRAWPPEGGASPASRSRSRNCLLAGSACPRNDTLYMIGTGRVRDGDATCDVVGRASSRSRSSS